MSLSVIWLNEAPLAKNQDGLLTSALASARYRCLIPAEALKSRGVENWTFGNLHHADPEEFGRHLDTLRADVAVIGKSFNPAMTVMADKIKARGLRLIVDFCDTHFAAPETGRLHRDLIALADVVVASTAQMAEIIKKETGAESVIIHDPYEGAKGMPRFAPASGASLKMLWYGHPSNLDTLAPVLPQLAQLCATQPLDLTIVTADTLEIRAFFAQIHAHASQVSGFTVRHVPWSLEGMQAALAACDLVIIPSLPQESKLVKGPNRLIEALHAGRAVVAYPLPSYREFRDVCILDENIVQGIAYALRDPAFVTRQIAAGQSYIEDHYSPSIIAEKWRAAFDKALAAETKVAPQVGTGLIRLNLGCGDKILEGYVNVDIADERAGKKPDIICDIRKLTLPDAYADEAMAIHVVEHLWRWDVVDVLREWHRVLKPGGKLVLECPNLITACQEVLKNPDMAALPGKEGQRSMWVLYGDPAWKDPLMCHRWGYTPASLGAVMQEAGFVNIRQEPAQFKMREPRDMRVVGEKP